MRVGGKDKTPGILAVTRLEPGFESEYQCVETGRTSDLIIPKLHRVRVNAVKYWIDNGM